MTVRVDLERDQSDQQPHEETCADVMQFEAQKFAHLADGFFLFLCLPFYLGIHLRVVLRVVLNNVCRFPCLVDVAVDLYIWNWRKVANLSFQKPSFAVLFQLLRLFVLLML